MSAGRIIAVIGGVLLILIGLAFVLPGAVLLWAYGTQRDADGFFQSPDRVVSTEEYALVSPNVEVHIGPDVADWIPEGAIGAVRVQAVPVSDEPLFLGIGPTDQVTEYLAGVAYDEITDFGWPGSVDYRPVQGAERPPSDPGQQDFWVVQEEGSGRQSLEWDVQDGDWTAVIMNANATPGVTAGLELGARFGIILAVGIGLTVVGVVLLGIGSVLLILGLVRTGRRDTPPPADRVAAVSAPVAEPPASEPPVSEPPGAAPSRTEPPSEPPPTEPPGERPPPEPPGEPPPPERQG